jgi:hypothetical protein
MLALHIRTSHVDRCQLWFHPSGNGGKPTKRNDGQSNDDEPTPFGKFVESESKEFETVRLLLLMIERRLPPLPVAAFNFFQTPFLKYNIYVYLKRTHGCHRTCFSQPPSPCGGGGGGRLWPQVAQPQIFLLGFYRFSFF